LKRFLTLSAIIIFVTNIFCQQGIAEPEKQYLKQRNNIIKSDGYKVSVKLTAEEKLLDAKLDGMKKELIKTYNGAFPYNFPILQDKRLQESALYKFSEKLPKGADLHVHGSELMSAPGYFDYVSKNEQVYICKQKGEKYGSLIAVKSGEKAPDGFISLISALNKKIFTREQLLNLWTVSPYGYATQTEAWDYFEALFDRVDVISSLKSESIRGYYYDAFKKYCENNILHIEFHRTIKTDIQREKMLELLIRQAYYDIKKEYPDFTLRIIATGLKNRSQDILEDNKRLEIAKTLQGIIKDEFDKNNIHNFIIGYDLVNEEDSSRSLLEYAEYLKKYRSKDFNFYLHAGESLRNNNYNLVDAYLLKAKRVGHGYNLYMFPKLLEKYKRAKIALEVCPVSNLRLGYVGDLRQHPAIEYIKRGLPVVIASDDPAFFEYKSLTDDWFAAILSFNLSLAEIKQLCMNSILYSGVSEQEKTRLMAAWQRQWQEFIKDYNNN